jgi:hypothetical protein
MKPVRYIGLAQLADTRAITALFRATMSSFCPFTFDEGDHGREARDRVQAVGVALWVVVLR